MNKVNVLLCTLGQPEMIAVKKPKTKRIAYGCECI